MSGSPSSAKPRSGSGARQIEQRVVIAATLHALALLSGVSPDQGLVENLLGNLHDVCVSSTATVKLTILQRACTVGLSSLLESDRDRYRIPGEESAILLLPMMVSPHQVTADAEEFLDKSMH